MPQDVRVNWLPHLSPHWLSGLIRLIWLTRQVFPSSLTPPYVSLWCTAKSKKNDLPQMEEDRSAVKGKNSCIPLLEPPKTSPMSNRRQQNLILGSAYSLTIVQEDPGPLHSFHIHIYSLLSSPHSPPRAIYIFSNSSPGSSQFSNSKCKLSDKVHFPAGCTLETS